MVDIFFLVLQHAFARSARNLLEWKISLDSYKIHSSCLIQSKISTKKTVTKIIQKSYNAKISFQRNQEKIGLHGHFNLHFWLFMCPLARQFFHLIFHVFQKFCDKLQNLSSQQETSLRLRRSEITGKVEAQCVIRRLDEWMEVCRRNVISFTVIELS